MPKKYPALVLKNYLINSCVNFLDVPLPAQIARSRNRFLKALSPRAEEFETERMKLINQYAEKGTDEKPLVMPNGNYKIKDQAAFDAAWKTLKEETATFDVLPSNMADFHVVKGIMLGLDTPMNVGETHDYEELCIAFEKLA